MMMMEGIFEIKFKTLKTGPVDLTQEQIRAASRCSAEKKKKRREAMTTTTTTTTTILIVSTKRTRRDVPTLPL
jgi:hypothetical protein